MKTYQRLPALFVYGNMGSERYDLFRSFHSLQDVLQRIWKNVSFAERVTWVLYSSEDPNLYRLQKDALHQVTDREIQEGDTVFIPISSLYLTVSMYIVIPSIQDERENEREHILYTPSNIYVIFEHYPYGKASTLQQTRQLQDRGIPREQIFIQMIETNRKFAATDLQNVDEALTIGTNFFEQRQLNVSSLKMSTSLTSQEVRQLLYHPRQYVQKMWHEQEERLKEFIDELHFLYEEDLAIALSYVDWANGLEKIFQHNIKMKDSFKLKEILQKRSEQFIRQDIDSELQDALLHTYPVALILSEEQSRQWYDEMLQQVIELVKKYIQELALYIVKKGRYDQKTKGKIYLEHPLDYKMTIGPTRQEVTDQMQKIIKDETLFLKKRWIERAQWMIGRMEEINEKQLHMDH